MSAFWDFSLEVYGGEGVKPACLALQATGLDVNVALWTVWSVLNGRDPGAALGQAVALSAHWSAMVVKPLRQARTHLKPAPAFVEPGAGHSLRQQILKAELEAERLEQLALEPLAASCPEHGLSPTQDDEGLAQLARQRLHDYAARCGVTAQATQAFVEAIFQTRKIV